MALAISGFQPRKGHGPHAQSAPGTVRDQSLRVGDSTQTTRHEPLSVRPRENSEVESHASRSLKSQDGGHPVALTSATAAPQLRAKDFPNFRDSDPAPWMIPTAAAAPAPRALRPACPCSVGRNSPSQVPSAGRRCPRRLRPAGLTPSASQQVSRARTHAGRPGLLGARSLARAPQGAQHLPAARSRPRALRHPALSAPLLRVPGDGTPACQR